MGVDLGGLALAVAAAGCNGSFGLFQKIKRVQDAQVSSDVNTLCQNNFSHRLLSGLSGVQGCMPSRHAVSFAQISPPAFNMWVCLGIVLSSLPLLAVEPRVRYITHA